MEKRSYDQCNQNNINIKTSDDIDKIIEKLADKNIQEKENVSNNNVMKPDQLFSIIDNIDDNKISNENKVVNLDHIDDNNFTKTENLKSYQKDIDTEIGLGHKEIKEMESEVIVKSNNIIFNVFKYILILLLLGSSLLLLYIILIV